VLSTIRFLRRRTLHCWGVAYAENFHGGVSFIGLWWSFVFGARCFWCHNLKSYSCFQTNVLATFVDIICMLFYDKHSPYFMCHCTEYKLSALQVRISEENTLNATTQQFITAKMRVRPVTRGELCPLRKFFAHPGKMCWTWFETIGHSSKNLGPSQKTLRPCWCLKLVTGLLRVKTGE